MDTPDKTPVAATPSEGAGCSTGGGLGAIGSGYLR